MNLFNHSRIQDLIDNGYNFDISSYFSEGFDITKKEVGLFIGYTFVFFIISMAASFIPFAGLLISPPLIAGYYIASHKVDRGEIIEFGDFFKGFDYFGQLVIQQLILILIMLVVAIPLFIILGSSIFVIASGGIPEESLGLVGILVVLFVFVAAIYFTVSYIFAQLFIVFGDMQAWDAMESSRKIVAKNFFPVFGLVILIGLLNMAGALLCGLGLLFTMPASYAIIYVAFKYLVDLDAPEGQADIMDHLVD